MSESDHFRDLFEEKTSQEKMDLLRLITDNMLDLVTLADCEGCVVWASPSYKALGYDSESLRGRPMLELAHPEDLEHVQSAMAEARKSKVSKIIECRIRRADGTYAWLESDGVFLFDGDGRPTGWIVNSRDITERKTAEEEQRRLEALLRHSQKMEAIGRLAGGVAHDFNNLLTGITGNTALAQLDLDPTDPLNDLLNEINLSAQRASGLTRQLLAFSRKQIIQPKVIDLNEVLENMHRMLVRIIGEDLELRTLPAHTLGRIKADPGQIEQIIVNLALNARDAMPGGGKLTIETADVSLDDAFCRTHPDVQPGSHVMLTVSDTGEGIDEETREHLFEPFFTTKQQGAGSGLGLATVYGIVKQHGGAIDVHSVQGAGATFRIYFPRVQGRARAVTRSSSFKDLPRGAETVLVVEDEAMVRNIAIRILTRLGYTVLSAEDGPSALERASEQNAPIDLLFTDIVMPHMNGRELAVEMNARYPELKVLYTSGYTEQTIAHHGVLDQGIEFLGKPYTPQGLAEKVREVLDGGAPSA